MEFTPNLNPLDPDFLIEQFWYGLKNSMINFYSLIKLPYTHIDLWSDNLNKLKKAKQYEQIEYSIREYITLYSYDLSKYSDLYYHDEILITNIKRWEKISNQFNFAKSQAHNKVLILFKIFLEIKKDPFKHEILNKFCNEAKPIEFILKTNDYSEIIIWSLSNDKSKILELVSQIINLDFTVRKLFPDFKFPNNSKGIKLCRLFDKYIKN